MQTRRKGKKQPSDFEALGQDGFHTLAAIRRSRELWLIRARAGSPTKLRGVLVCRNARVPATAYRDIAFSRVGVRKHTLLIQRTVRARRTGQLLDASSVHRQGATRARRQRLPSEGGLRKVQRGGAGHP
jgi:hypothetical protein